VSYGILLHSDSPSFCPVAQMNRTLLIIFTLYLVSIEAFADVDLYSGEVVVTSQGESDRKEAVPDALIQVLQKLSGKREMPFSPALDDALVNAGGLLRSTRYTNVDRIGPGGTLIPELHLIASFMQAEVDTLLQQAGLPRWQQERPSVQIWVVIENGLNRDLKPVEFDYAWLAMEELANSRGLSLSWPELDEEQLQLIDMRLVWGGFTDYLVERGAPSDGVAIIAARREGPEWTLRWNLSNGDQNWSWRNTDHELMFALSEGVHRMTDQLAAANAIAVSEQGQMSVEFTIGGLNGSNAYVRCLEYLENLSLVTSVEVVGAQPGRVNFRLQLNASNEHLIEAFYRSSILTAARAGSEYDYEYIP
jgi:hypothetical protein